MTGIPNFSMQKFADLLAASPHRTYPYERAANKIIVRVDALRTDEAFLSNCVAWRLESHDTCTTDTCGGHDDARPTAAAVLWPVLDSYLDNCPIGSRDRTLARIAVSLAIPIGDVNLHDAVDVLSASDIETVFNAIMMATGNRGHAVAVNAVKPRPHPA
jgi:hypothetical protein